MDQQMHVPKESASQAPYNFIPLNETVITAETLPPRNQYDLERKTGVITCQLTTKSPLYVAGHSASNNKRDVVFFHQGDTAVPAIPGSSLRGMTRNLLEIITYSKMQPVSKHKLGYRHVFGKDDQVTAYHNQLQHVKAGILRQEGGEYFLEPCNWFRVSYDVLEKHGLPKSKLYENKGRQGHERKFPRWQDDSGKPVQHRPVWVDVNQIEEYKVQTLFWKEPVPITPDIRQGLLVLTGYMNDREHKYIFLRQAGAKLVLAQTAVDELESDQQISEWQQLAFPKDKPSPRRKDGGVYDGEPVFYITGSDGTIETIGRARYFRLPYPCSAYDLLPESHKDDKQIDMAEAIFGFVDKVCPETGEKYARASRVYFSDATMPNLTENLWLDNKTPRFKAKNLASPKPTAYRHYLVQTELHNLKTYQDAATLRGHKMYWHQGQMKDGKPELLQDKEHFAHPDQDSETTQDVYIKPLRSGLDFTFRVHFENLTDAELGALLWSLEPPPPVKEEYAYCHKLGMGKPLGMGAVHITIQSVETLDKNAQRYEQLFDQANWQTGLTTLQAETIKNKFTQFVENAFNWASGEFNKQPRLQALLNMMRYPGVEYDKVSYMDLTDERWSHKVSKASFLLPDIGINDKEDGAYQRARLSFPKLTVEPVLRDLYRSQMITCTVARPDDGYEVYVTLDSKYANLNQDDPHFEAWIAEDERGGYGWRARIREKIRCVVLEIDENGNYVILRRKP